MKRKLMMAGMACMMVLQALSQASLKGRVTTDSGSIINATVALDKHYQITDSTGAFQFHLLNEGKHNLSVSMVGQEPYFKTLWLKKNENSEIEIRLQPAVSSLDAIVVSGTMKPVSRLESPVAVEVYTPQFFRKNPSPSVFEALQNINGVRPQLNCSVCNTGDIHINGLEGPYTMVTIDGMPVVSSLSSVYGLFGIPSELIERVEIIKGPASGLYGAEAIGGLINIITKSPQKAPLFSASIMNTSWMEHTADLGLKIKTGKLQSLLGINYHHYQKEFDKNHDLFTDVTLQKRISVFNKWSLQRQENRIATLAARYFYEDRWGGDTRWNKSFRGGDSIYGESIYTSRWELIGNYQLPVGEEKLLLSYSVTSHEQNSFYGKTPYMANQNILFTQLIWEKPWRAQHSFLMGLSSRYQYYDDNSTATLDTLTKKKSS
jgi:outer membrane receptor for ferrienterochelin and colicins